MAEEKQKSKKKIADLIYKNAEEKADLQVELSRSNRKNQELSKRIKFLDDEIAQLKRFILKFQNELVRKQELILAAKRKMLRQDSIQEKFFVDRMMTENLKRTSNRLCQTDFQDEKKQDSVQRIIVDDAKESETVIKETDFEEQSIHQYNSDETSNGKVCNHTELPDSSCVSLSSESSINNTDFQSFDLENDQVNILEIENFSKILIQDQFLKFEAQNCDNLQIQDTDI